MRREQKLSAARKYTLTCEGEGEGGDQSEGEGEGGEGDRGDGEDGAGGVRIGELT